VAHRSNAGGSKKRPTRYGSATTPLLATALRLHKKGELPAAKVAYRHAIELDDCSVDAWLNLGAVEVALGSVRAARAAFERALALAPDDARVARDVGIGRMALGLLADARAALECAIALDSALTGARLHLSRVCAELNDSFHAREHARMAVQAAPLEAATHLELHRAVFDDGDARLAIDAARRAVELDPSYSLAHYFLAGALALQGEPARDDIAVDPGLVDGLRYAIRMRDGETRYFANRQETLRFALESAALRGAVLELGVRFGVSTRVLATGAPEVIAFDSFEGLPEAWSGRARGAFSTGGEPPELPANVRLQIGWFEDTLPPFVATLQKPLRLVHIDSDLYTSAATALAALGAHIGAGTVIVFDEYIGNGSWRADEHRAFQEAVRRFGWRYEYLAFSWITGQAVVRIT